MEARGQICLTAFEKLVGVLIGWASPLVATASARALDFDFQLYEGETEVLDALIVYSVAGTGTEPAYRGDRVMRCPSRELQLSTEGFQNGETKSFPMTLKRSVVLTEEPADDWQAVINFQHCQVGN